MTYQSHSSAPGAGEWLMGAVKKNPEGMLLLAAGCALLLRSGGWSGRSSSPAPASRSGAYGDQGSSRQSRASDVSETVSRAAENARDYATEVGKTVGETASNYAAAVGEYAGDAGRTVVDQSERLARQTQATFQQTMNRVLKEQPLALAVMGLAAGAAVAAALPSTDAERRALGPAGEKLSEAASAVGENLTQAASKAGERLLEAADERGLNKDGLKKVAEEVAGAFEGAFRGDEQSRSNQSPGSGSTTPSQSGQSRGELGGSQVGNSSKPGGSVRS